MTTVDLDKYDVGLQASHYHDHWQGLSDRTGFLSQSDDLRTYSFLLNVITLVVTDSTAPLTIPGISANNTVQIHKLLRNMLRTRILCRDLGLDPFQLFFEIHSASMFVSWNEYIYFVIEESGRLNK